MSKDPDWMPVFVLVERRHEVHAAHPSHRDALPRASASDVLQRVGTARREADGGYLIHLTALPVSGQLLMRPPRPDESPDSTIREERQ